VSASAKELDAIHARWAPVEERVGEIRAGIERACGDIRPGESFNRANERQVEEFIGALRGEFSGRTYEVERGGAGQRGAGGLWLKARERTDAPVVVIERQRLSPWALRTTRWNYIFTVPGESPAVLLLVAHYDTWRGPGADDNTTGEEILKQYLLADLRAEKRPAHTHVYFLAGSEECGLVGLLSQLLLAAAVIVAIHCVRQGSWHLLPAALALLPMASYRFGVSGSREYVRALSADELAHIKAVVSVDSVGEGRMFIPRSTLGADFVRALIPFGHYPAFTEVLEEGAHLHGVKYNNYIAGGTTDHLSFLEVNNGLWARGREALRRAGCWLSGRAYKPPRLIPASALVAMLPGKASPVVFGGKIHTKNDVPARVYPEPLREALLILDYVFHICEGGARVREPRKLEEFHYARLYEVSCPGKPPEFWAALKDALEPNRRNLNALYRAEAEVDEQRREGRVVLREPLHWGVETRLRDEVREVCRQRGAVFRRVWLDRMTVSDGKQEFAFGRRLTPLGNLRRYGMRGLARLERLLGHFNFLAFFAVAYVIALVVSGALNWGFAHSFAFQTWFFNNQWATIPLMLVFQIGLLFYLMVRRIPTWIDNNYRHDNRSDNMGSLRRLAA
jgi:hypothetical protein